jgi:hypothetical protein
MALINLQKTVETVQWSDDPDAKAYEIDFSDPKLEEYKAALESLQQDLKATGEGDKDKLAAIIHEFVATVAGEECYRDALAYVDVKGVGAENCIHMMLGLCTGLSELIVNHLERAKAKRVEKYLDDEII